ncbi:hypothetical protein LTR09_007952 [Extremus antarcticus]|uniref:Uncharacterized protein n=1 Tax=Extremus antarcticus TaxID=702011 RepID=A0AAJ0DBH3_9PEZI|nr:hypothetical protein LTR09_007952 [Extremus antarcticus]
MDQISWSSPAPSFSDDESVDNRDEFPHERLAAQTQPPIAPHARTRGLRRPRTTDSRDFWYISEDRWQELLSDTGAASKIETAMGTLRRFDQAGRIMETAEGVLATEEYGNHKVCAYCKRGSRSGCNASLVTRPLTLEQRLEKLEVELKITKVNQQGLENELATTKQRLATEQAKLVKVGKELVIATQRIDSLEQAVHQGGLGSNFAAPGRPSKAIERADREPHSFSSLHADLRSLWDKYDQDTIQ